MSPRSRSRQRRCLLFHHWREIGVSGLLVRLHECDRCRWQKCYYVLGGRYSVTYPPGTWKTGS